MGEKNKKGYFIFYAYRCVDLQPPLSMFYQSAVIGVNALGVWNLYLSKRVYNSFQKTTIPAPFKDAVSEEEFQKYRNYGTDSTLFEIVDDTFDLILNNIELIFKIPSRLYKLTSNLFNVTLGSFAHSYLFSVTSDAISTLIKLPFSYYETFVVEEKHGFNKTTKTVFFMDELKSFALRATLLYPVQTGLIQFVVRRFGESFPTIFFACAACLLFFFMHIYPTVIMPLFNKFTPLNADSPLYAKLQQLAVKVKYPLKKIFIIDGSRRSSHSNAFLYGFGSNKRIVLFDTLLEQMKEKEECIVSVLCHELGHWHYGHTTQMLVATLSQLFGLCYGAKTVIFNPSMYREFGFDDQNPIIGFDLYAQVFLQPIFTVTGYCLCYISRRNEFQADAFAVLHGFGEELKEALIILTKGNKANLNPDPLSSALTNTHPPVVERLAAIDEDMQKMAKRSA